MAVMALVQVARGGDAPPPLVNSEGVELTAARNAELIAEAKRFGSLERRRRDVAAPDSMVARAGVPALVVPPRDDGGAGGAVAKRLVPRPGGGSSTSQERRAT